MTIDPRNNKDSIAPIHQRITGTWQAGEEFYRMTDTREFDGRGKQGAIYKAIKKITGAPKKNVVIRYEGVSYPGIPSFCIKNNLDIIAIGKKILYAEKHKRNECNYKGIIFSFFPVDNLAFWKE